MKNITKLVQLQSIKRHNMSRYGNPSLKVDFTYIDELGDCICLSGRTASDCACGYVLQNYGVGEWVYLTFHFTKKGNCIITKEGLDIK